MTYVKRVAFAAAVAGSVSAQVLGGSEVQSTATLVSVQSTTSTVDSADASVFSILAAAGATASTTAVVAQQATSSVVSIYFPGADKLPYVASLIGQNDGAQTLAISCGPGVDADTCGFPSSVTVTAGPSTAYVSVSNGDATFIYDCKISASTTAICAETFNGALEYIISATGSGQATPTGSTSSVLTETLASTDITWMPITITAMGTGASNPSNPPVPAPSNSQQQASSNLAQWSNLGSGSGSGSIPSQSTPVASSSASTSASTSTALSGGSTTTSPGTATTPVPASGTWNSWQGPATYTGAAAKLNAVANYAAGFMALAGLAL